MADSRDNGVPPPLPVKVRNSQRESLLHRPLPPTPAPHGVGGISPAPTPPEPPPKAPRPHGPPGLGGISPAPAPPPTATRPPGLGGISPAPAPPPTAPRPPGLGGISPAPAPPPTAHRPPGLGGISPAPAPPPAAPRPPGLGGISPAPAPPPTATRPPELGGISPAPAPPPAAPRPPGLGGISPAPAPPPPPPKPLASAGLLESMQDDEILTDQDIPEVKYGDYSNKTVEPRPIYAETESLRVLQQRLIHVAETCNNDYTRQEIQKNPAERLEVVKRTTSAIASALHQLTREINHMATEFCHRLDQHSTLLAEMKQQTYWVEMKAGIILHRKDLNHVKKFARMKNKPYTPLCYKGITYPKEKAPKVKASRMPQITYDRFDHIGHGVQIDDAVLFRAVTEMFVYGRRPSAASTRSALPSTRDSRLSRSSIDSTSSASTIHSTTSSTSSASTIDSSSSAISAVPVSVMNSNMAQAGKSAAEEKPAAMSSGTTTGEEEIYANFDVAETRNNEGTTAIGGAAAAVRVDAVNEYEDDEFDEYEDDEFNEYEDDEFIYMNEELADRSVVSRGGVDRWAPAEFIFKGVVLYEYEGQSAEELTISYGETIYVTWLEENNGPWCQGMTVNGCGLVPLNYIQRGNTPDKWLSQARDDALRESFI